MVKHKTSLFLLVAGLLPWVAGADTTPVGVYGFHDAKPEQAPEMVLVPTGKFTMGDTENAGAKNEYPVHKVSIDKPFAVGKYEVTVGQFGRFVKATGYVTDAEKGNNCFTYDSSRYWMWQEGSNWRSPGFRQQDDHPVVCVSWRDAQAYVQWLSKETGEAYRLPSEAEWEYVARAGTEGGWFWGKADDCKSANCCTGVLWLEKQTQTVGSYAANSFGLHDTAGNVWEWTASPYHERYNGSEMQVLSSDAGLADAIAVRGGSWYRFEAFVRSAARGGNWPQSRFSDVGFRVARDVTPEFVAQAQAKLAQVTRVSVNDNH